MKEEIPIYREDSSRGKTGDMMREVLSAVMAMILVANLNSAGAAPQEDSKSAKTRLLAIPMGSLVGVRLNDNEKIRGRMGEVSDEGFVIQAVQGGKVENRKIAFIIALVHEGPCGTRICDSNPGPQGKRR